MKKRLLLALAFACAPVYADMVARNDKDYVRLTQSECHAEVAKLIPEELSSMFLAAYAQIEGKQYRACWVVRADANVLLVYADGDMALIPVKFFNKENGI